MTDLRQGVSAAVHDVLDLADVFSGLPAANRNDSIGSARRDINVAWNTIDAATRRAAVANAAAHLLVALEIMDEEAAVGR